MDVFESVIAVLGGAFLAIVVLTVFVMSLFGKDLLIFDCCKTAAPEVYRNLRSVCRFNCPLVALMCIGGLAATPFIAVAPDGGVLLAISTLVVSMMFLWLSVRWFIWSLRAPAPETRAK